MEYKHYSFDLWGTLIKSHPVFKEERAEYLAYSYDKIGMNCKVIERIIRDVDIMSNTVNEVCGGNITAEEMYTMVLYKLGWKAEGITKDILNRIYENVWDMFRRYKPIVLDGSAFVIKELRRRGATTSLISNTAFIKGEMLRDFISSSNLSGLFDFQLYSDEIGVSKPNPKAYAKLLHNVLKVNQTVNTTKEVIHIGDSKLADEIGAQGFYLETFLINSNDKNILNVL